MEASGPLGRSTVNRTPRLVAVVVALALASLPWLAASESASAEFKFLGQWGSPTGGELIFPADVERDNAGNTYVVDTAIGVVHKYDAANHHLLSFGSLGSGPGQFTNPFALGVNEATGQLYVSDVSGFGPGATERIERFDSGGHFLGQFGSFGTGAGQFENIRGIAVQPVTGDVFVTEQNRVQRFNALGQFELMWGKDVVPGGGTGPETCVSGCKAGLTGTAAGELASPHGIATLGNSVFVSEDGNSRVQRFNATTGAFQIMGGRDVQPGGGTGGETCIAGCQAGLRGSGPGELDEPRGLDANVAFGFVYIVDQQNHRVQRWSGNLSYLSEFGTEGSGNGQFQGPIGLTENQGTVIVTDVAVARAQSFTGLGAFQGRFGDPGPATISIPTGIGAGPGGIYVTDQLNRVVRFDAGGRFIGSWGSAGSAPGQFSRPAGITAAADGNVYVADGGNNRVQRFDSAGAALGAFGAAGDAPGQFAGAADVAIGRGGGIYVVESGGNNRVQRFSPIGGFEGTWGAGGDAPGQFAGAQGIATDPSGNVYVADTGNDRIEKFDADGKLLKIWGSTGIADGQFHRPSDIAVDGAGNVFVADQDNNRVQAFSAAGEFRGRWGANGGGGAAGDGPGEFNHPISVAVDGPGYIYVLDQLNDRVQRFAGTPAVTVTGKRRQGLGRLRVEVSCTSGPCAVTLSGKVKTKPRPLKIKLKPVTLTLDAGATVVQQLKPRKAKRSVRRANALLGDGGHAKVKVGAVVTNEAGSGTAKAKVKLRRAR